MRRSKSFEPLTPRAAHGFLTSIYLSQSCLVCLFVCLFLLTSPKRRDCLAISRIICMEKTVAFRIQTISSFEVWKRKKNRPCFSQTFLCVRGSFEEALEGFCSMLARASVTFSIK